jgi:hypothetical protein
MVAGWVMELDMLNGSVVQVFTNHWFDQRDVKVDNKSVKSIASSRIGGDGKRSDEDGVRTREKVCGWMGKVSRRVTLKSDSSKRSIDGRSVASSSKPCIRWSETGKAYVDVCG